jgi:hypothetical protein
MSGKSKVRIKHYKDFTLERNGTRVEIRVVGSEKLVWYRVTAQGPYFLEDMANMRQTWTRGLGWQFLPWPR